MNKQQQPPIKHIVPISRRHMEMVQQLAFDFDGYDSARTRSKKNHALLLRDILHLLFKRKRLIVTFFAVVTMTVAVSTFLTKPMYRGSAQILVKMGRQDLYGNDYRAMRPASEEQINTEIEILKSRSLAEKTLLSLGPANVYPQIREQDQGPLREYIQKIKDGVRRISDVAYKYVLKLFPKQRKRYKAKSTLDSELLAALPMFQKSLKIEGYGKSNLIRVSFTHENPNMSATVTNTLTDIYLDHHLAVHKTAHAYDFFQAQTRLLEEKLQRSQQTLKTFKDQHGIISLDEERSLALRGMAELRANLNQTRSLEEETKKRIRQLNIQLKKTPRKISQGEVIMPNQSLISQLETRLVELEIDLKGKGPKTKYTKSNRTVKEVEAEMRMLRKKLAEQEKIRYGSKRSGINPTYQRLQDELLRSEADLDAFRAKKLAQKSQLNDYNDRLTKLNTIEDRLNQLQESVDVNKQNFRLYRTKFEETRISDEMDSVKIAGVSLIEAARPPLKPINRKFKLNLMLAAVLGLFGGLSLAFLMKFISNRLETVEDVEECLDLPVLASIPELKL